MLSLTTMGGLALGAFWLNLVLIAAAALKQRSALGERLRMLETARASGGFIDGEIAPSSEAFAERRVAQVGRAMTVRGPDRILFTDKRSESRVRGGEIEAATGPLRVAADPACELWIGATDVPAVRDADFEEAWASASTSRGVELDAVQRLPPGTRVWVLGERREDGIRPMLIATTCPFRTLARARRVLFSAALLAVLGGAAVTALVLAAPLFGTVSTIGGALGLVFFLLVQPAGVAARTAARVPAEQSLGGVWQRGQSQRA